MGGGIPSPHSAAAAVLDIHARPYVRPTVPIFLLLLLLPPQGKSESPRYGIRLF